MAKRPEIVVLNGELAGRRFAVGAGTLRLGRSSSNDIHIPDEELSRNHCMFEASGEDGVRIADLGSANGTIVNGETIGDKPVELKEGDIIEIGSLRLRVGDAPAPAPAAGGAVDLGLGAPVTEASPNTPAKRRSPVANILWVFAILFAVTAIALILFMPEPEIPVKSVAAEPKVSEMKELVFEKVRANAEGIFRFALVCGADGQLTVKIDDTSNDRRMAPKHKPLSVDGREELNRLLDWKTLKEFDDEYTGVEPDPPALDSCMISVVYSDRVKRVTVTNTQEPDAFGVLREKLEAFAKSELGVWAVSYPRERLVELAEQAIELAQAKWNDREVNHGNIAAAIAAYEEAIFYLETVNPKPECAQTAVDGLKVAKDELDRRYKDQRFRADKALNLSEWESARDELKILLEMVPDRKDDRNREVRQKLLSAESNLKKKGGN